MSFTEKQFPTTIFFKFRCLSLTHTYTLSYSLSTSLSLTHTLLDLIVVLQNEIVTCAQLITIIMCQLMMIIRMA